MIEFKPGDRVKVEPLDERGGPTREVTVDRIVGDYVGVTSDEYIPDRRASATEMVVHHSQVVEVISSPTAQADISETPAPQITNVHNF